MRQSDFDLVRHNQKMGATLLAPFVMFPAIKPEARLLPSIFGLAAHQFDPSLPQLVAIDDCALSARSRRRECRTGQARLCPDGGIGSGTYDCHTRSHSPRSPILARAVGRSSAVSPPPSWTMPTSLPRAGLNACKTLKPLAAFSPPQRRRRP